MEIEELLDRATQFLTSLGTHWKTQPVHIQKRFQQLVYPTGIPYSRETGFGTAQLGLIFEINRRFVAQKSTRVDSRLEFLNEFAKESTRLAEILKNKATYAT